MSIKKSSDDEEPVRLCNYTDVYYNEEITEDIEFMEATTTEAKANRFRLREGDILITKIQSRKTTLGSRPMFHAEITAEDIYEVLVGALPTDLCLYALCVEPELTRWEHGQSVTIFGRSSSRNGSNESLTRSCERIR